MRVVKHWYRVSRQAVASPHEGIQDMTLSNQIYLDLFSGGYWPREL